MLVRLLAVLTIVLAGCAKPPPQCNDPAVIASTQRLFSTMTGNALPNGSVVTHVEIGEGDRSRTCSASYEWHPNKSVASKMREVPHLIRSMNLDLISDPVELTNISFIDGLLQATPSFGDRSAGVKLSYEIVSDASGEFQVKLAIEDQKGFAALRDIAMHMTVFEQKEATYRLYAAKHSTRLGIPVPYQCGDALCFKVGEVFYATDKYPQYAGIAGAVQFVNDGMLKDGEVCLEGIKPGDKRRFFSFERITDGRCS